MECKLEMEGNLADYMIELIDTLWNVNNIARTTIAIIIQN